MENKTQIFITKAKLVHGDKYFYDEVEYISTKHYLKIGCKIHGIFLQTPPVHLGGKTGCKMCEFLVKAKAAHGDLYDYSETVYVASKQSLKIICKVHGAFYQKPENHYQNGCSECGKELVKKGRRNTNDEFITKAIKMHGDRYNYDGVEYISTHSPVKIRCKIHGIFSQKPVNHLQGSGCNSCNLEKAGSHFKSCTEEFKEKAFLVHGFRYDYSDSVYILSNVKINIKCDIHGVFRQIPNSHLMGAGCSKCSKVYQRTKDEHIERFIDVHGHKYDYSFIVELKLSAYTKINIVCKIHGVFTQTVETHGLGSGCPSCKNKTEGKLLNWLETNTEWPVCFQRSYNDCRSPKGCRYRFDYMVGNTHVELDGDQHFRLVYNWETNEKTLKSDIIKTKYILNRGHNLIRIYQPWVFYDTNDWESKLTAAIINLESKSSTVVYIGGDIYDNHKKALKQSYDD